MFSLQEVYLTQKQDFMIYLIPTYDCNLRCTYCFVPKYGGYKINTQTLEELAVCLEKYVDTNKMRVGILGWEPFLYKDLLVETISFLSKRLADFNLDFYIGTNGLLVNEKVLTDLKDIPARIEIAFSIDGIPETVSKDRTKSQNPLLGQTLIKNFLLAKKILWRENTSITMTIAASSIDTFEENIKYLFDLNPYFLRFRLASGDNWTKEKVDIYLKQFHKIYLYYIDTLYIKWWEQEIPVIEQFEYMINIKSDNLWPCSKWVNLTLTPDGYFVPCYNFLTKEKQEQHKYHIPISELAYTSEYDSDFQNWRAKAYSHNNGRKDSEENVVDARYNFSICITGSFQDEDRQIVLDAWQYREEQEKNIGLQVFHYYFTKHGKNLYELSKTYNR